jgi:peptide deformylase
MIRPILKYGDSVLHRPAEPVVEVTAEVAGLARDMVETMYAAPGIGLAAPQVGVPVRLFVVDLTLGRDPKGLIVLVNPEMVDRDGMQLEDEGCLSLPGFSATVARPARATVRGITLDGQETVIEGRGLLARALQHEMDHLDGHVFLERLRGLRRNLIVRRIRRQMRCGRW